jgi:transposase
MKITTVGLDLAKSVFQVHGVDEAGKVVVRKTLRRAELMKFFTKLVPCLIGMEACGSAHFWARQLAKLGHTVKLMAPQFVKPYVKTNKNDARDAEAICEAVSRPNMRFVPVKTLEQQSVLTLHRARQGFVAARTAQANQIRGLLSEFGLVIPKGIGCLERQVPGILADAHNGLAGRTCELFSRLLSHFRELDRQVKSWRCRSRVGTARTRPAEAWRRFRESDRSPPVHWWPVSGMRLISAAGARWQRGWVWYRARTPPGANSGCWGSVSAVTCICERCSFTGRARYC